MVLTFPFFVIFVEKIRCSWLAGLEIVHFNDIEMASLTLADDDILCVKTYHITRCNFPLNIVLSYTRRQPQKTLSMFDKNQDDQGKVRSTWQQLN